MTKLLTSGILILTAVDAALVTKPVLLGILPCISLSLAFRSVFLTNPLVSGIFFSASLIMFSKSDLSVSYLVFKTKPVVSILFTFETNFLYAAFLTTSFFATSRNLLKSTRTIFSLSTSVLSTSVFKLAKFDFTAILEVSIPAASF